MTDQQVRYDRIAEGYATWWSPVHRAATLRLLDEVDEAVASGARRILDVGCGTGAMAVAAAERWPSVAVDGVDASDGMLAIARRELDAQPRTGPGSACGTHRGTRTGCRSTTAPSTWCCRRSCCSWSRPGRAPCARCGGCSGRADAWLTCGGCRATGFMAADAAYDEALAAAGLEPRDPGNDHPDLASRSGRGRPAAPRGVPGRDGTRRTGSSTTFTPEGFAGFITRFDDEDLFRSMEPAARADLEADLLRRLRALPPDGLRLVLPIVYASGRRG